MNQINRQINNRPVDRQTMSGVLFCYATKPTFSLFSQDDFYGTLRT